MLKQLKPLIDNSLVRKHKAGSTILYQGEVPRSACIINKGIVRVFSISAQGDEQIVMYHVAGEFFPASWIFDKSRSTLFFYEAVEDTEIAYCTKDELLNFMYAKPERIKIMLDYFTTNYCASLIQINALEQPKARDKLLYTLYYLSQRYGENNSSSSKTRILFSLTHQNLASLVGLTRETTATELNKLKKEKILTYKNQKYSINLEKLLEKIGEDSFREISIEADLRS